MPRGRTSRETQRKMAGNEDEAESRGQTQKHFQCTISKKVDFLLKPAARTMLNGCKSLTLSSSKFQFFPTDEVII